MALVNELVRRYEAAGLEDVTLVSYPNARHEVFKETNRDEVVSAMIE
jgi:alpha-beta hydrolase superfamily lysophospholipase